MVQKTLRVLVVDDNRDGADALGILLDELGNEVRVAYGGRQALEAVATFPPDLILVDLIMPDIDGCELVSRFVNRRPSRTRASWPSPVIGASVFRRWPNGLGAMRSCTSPPA